MQQDVRAFHAKGGKQLAVQKGVNSNKLHTRLVQQLVGAIHNRRCILQWKFKVYMISPWCMFWLQADHCIEDGRNLYRGFKFECGIAHAMIHPKIKHLSGMIGPQASE